MIPRRTLVAAGLTGAAGVALWAYPRWLTDRSEEMDAADVAKPGEVVDVDGVAIHYLEQGQGPALVLIHGLGGSTYNFHRSFPGLSRHLRVVALDLKGFGYSERLAGGDYSQRAEVTATDEVGQLAYTLNEMAYAIQEHETELQNFTASLEQRVESRTAEL